MARLRTRLGSSSSHSLSCVVRHLGQEWALRNQGSNVTVLLSTRQPLIGAWARCRRWPTVTSQPRCSGAKWWLLRTLGADQLSRCSKLPGVWASAARSSGSEQHGATTPAGPSKTSPFSASPSPTPPSPNPSKTTADGEARSEEEAQAERTGKSHRPAAQEQEKSQFEREQEEGRRLEAEQDAAEEAERMRCREKGRRAAGHASPIARAWLEDDHRPAID